MKKMKMMILMHLKRMDQSSTTDWTEPTITQSIPPPHQPPIQIYTCAADGTIRVFDLEAPLAHPPPPSVQHMGPVTITSRVLPPSGAPTRVVGRNENIVHDFAFWEGTEGGASTLLAALDKKGVMRYDLRAPSHQGELAIDTGRLGGAKALAIPDPHNLCRGISPFMVCVGGFGAGLNVYDLRCLPVREPLDRPLQRFCPRNLPPDFTHMIAVSTLAAFGHRGPGAEEVSVSGLAFSKQRPELLVSYQGDQIYGFRTDDEERVVVGVRDGVHEAIGEAWSLGGHLNSQTFLKNVCYFGPKEEYVVSGCDSGHTWVWDRRTGALAAHQRTDTQIANGAAPHPWAPTLACYGIDNEVKILEAGGGRYFSCLRPPNSQPEAYADDDAEPSPAGRPAKRGLLAERRSLGNWLEQKQMEPVRSVPPRFVHDAERFRRHVARLRRGMAEEAPLALSPLREPGMDPETRRRLLLLPDFASDVEDVKGKPRYLRALVVGKGGEGEGERREGTEVLDEVYLALVAVKERGNAFFKAKSYARARDCYRKVQNYLAAFAKWGPLMEKEGRDGQEKGGGGGGGAEGEAIEARVTRHEELMVVATLNLAACCLAQGVAAEAVAQLDGVLRFRPGPSLMAKALFRRGTALMALQRYEEAVHDLGKAAAAEQEDQVVQRKLAEAKRLYAAKRSREARAYAVFFGGEGEGEGRG
jgi:hypothetical protein